VANAAYLKGLMAYKNNRYVNLMNWEQLKGDSNVVNAIKETLAE
jgi:hypothetical protein